MKVIRVINISNKQVIIGETTILAHKVVDFPLDILSKSDLEDISAYAAVGVVRAFEFDKPDTIETPVAETAEEVVEEETTPKRSKKK